MVFRTFLDKCNTIVKGSNDNFGLNPILMLHYGGLVSRILIHFDIEELKNRIGENVDNFSHKLLFTNCGSLDTNNFNSPINSFSNSGIRERATSFDIIAFEVPVNWDNGIGFDSLTDYWFGSKACLDTNGSNWYQATNGLIWDNEGIYTSNELSKEYTKFGNGEESIIISRQHFDYGNENLELDITNYINDLLKGNKVNKGICLAFSPLLEDSFSENTQYVGFFGKSTNTFFHPCLESRSDIYINDNRFDFQIGKENNLYFFLENDGDVIKLDKLPTCTINDKTYPVCEIYNGYYYAKVNLNKNDIEPDSVIYDVWSNIVVDGNILDDVENSFVAYSPNKFINVGRKKNKKEYEPQLQGISDYEKINRGEIRNIDVFLREKFTVSSYELVSNMEYQIYVLDGTKQIDVIKWDKVNKMENFNTFILDTNNLIPNTYYIDIKCKLGNEIKIYKKCLEFTVVSNKTNEKR